MYRASIFGQMRSHVVIKGLRVRGLAVRAGDDGLDFNVTVEDFRLEVSGC